MTTDQQSPVTFDPAAFKATTRQQWQDAADAWHRWGPTIGDWLGQATDTMIRLARIEQGHRVLDVAAGAGEQSLHIARVVGASGTVIASDIAPELLRRAAQDAEEAGLAQVETLELDGEDVGTLAGSDFDAVVSRVGLIYFPDQQKALRGMHSSLRDGGRVSTVVYSTPDENRFFSIPVGIIRRRAQLPPPLPGQPGPFSLGQPGVLAEALTSAGFVDVEVESVPSPLRLRSAADCVQFQRESFGALHQMMGGLSPDEREAAWREVEEALGEFEGPDGFVGPCTMLVGAATARH
ncbi:MAG: class I SAM-dependent methyltransferase [Aeromicrobium sp.]